MNRRSFLKLSTGLSSILDTASSMRSSKAQISNPSVNLLSAPLEVAGDWGGSPRGDAAVVISRMREACLSGLRLLSDRQPDHLRVDDHTSGPPHVWLHSDNPTTAWIVVDVAPRAWSQLAYQFGHELGHVMCNSWMWKVETPPPSRWLEECLAEAFSIRGLGRLAEEWEHHPPFAGDAKYGRSLRTYRQDLVHKYEKAGGTEPITDLAAWFLANRPQLDRAGGVSVSEGPAIVAVVRQMEADKCCVEDLEAINRWPERSAVPVEDYLRLWQVSCEELQLSGNLPARLRKILCIRAAKNL
jgi:hypothetical protein